MVDTPKENNGDEATGDNPSGKKSKHGRHQRRSKPRHSNTGTGEENPDGAKEEYNPDQPTFEQANRNTGRSAQMNRRRTDTWRTITICLPPKTR